MVVIWLCHGYRFACQQGVLKTFPGPRYPRSKMGLLTMALPSKFACTYLTILSCYDSIPVPYGKYQETVVRALCVTVAALLASRGC